VAFSAQDDPPGLLFRAGLARLCGKPKQLTAATLKAKRVFDQGRFKAYEKSVMQVRYHQSVPNAFIPLSACAP
jgi:hypothetical protein